MTNTSSQDVVDSNPPKSPPHNLEAEKALLGAILVNNEAVQKVQWFLEPEHFYEPVHGRIFDAALKLIDQVQIADPITLKSYFENDEALVEVGGTKYLDKLATSASTIINAEDYGLTIFNLALRRQIISIAEHMTYAAYNSDVDYEILNQIESAQTSLFDLAEQVSYKGGLKSFNNTLIITVQNIEAAFRDPHGLSGITTGLNSLDEMTGGMHGSDFVILAGRPAMGKTALAANIGYNAAQRWLDDKSAEKDMGDTKGAMVGFFSLGISAEQFSAPILLNSANLYCKDPIHIDEMLRGKLSQEQFEAVARAACELEEVPFYIDDTPDLTIARLRSRARTLKHQQGLGMIIVEDIQLLYSHASTKKNRHQTISEITQGLKGIALELNIPVIALYQLPHKIEQRENKRPKLSDFRKYSSIVKDADMVLFMFREEYYKKKEQPTEGTQEYDVWLEDMKKMCGKTEVIVAKQRHGPVGTVQLEFNGATHRFSDIVMDDYLLGQNT